MNTNSVSDQSKESPAANGDGDACALKAQLEAVNAEFQQFTHCVSHDLRAPLRALEGFAQILSEDYGGQLDPEGRRCLEILGASARKTSLLLEDLLLFSRLFQHVPSISRLSMSRLAEERAAAVRETAAPAKIQIDKLPDAAGDAELLGQVWERLLDNAVKFSRGRPGPLIEIGGRDEPGRMVYFVRDNGVGFEMKYATRLFGAFQRLHGEKEFPGRGIGLAIVKRIILMHGGEVWADAKLNEGATFFFSLPKRKARMPEMA